MFEDTIAAVATPRGKGGIAVIRISGTNARDILRSVFSNKGELEHAKMVYGYFGKDGARTDSGYGVIFYAPVSYTGEDVAEIHCHGSEVGVRELMQAVVAAGARPAQPGEFTRRAFVNGKMDLSQAEAVCDYISSISESAVRVARGQMEGEIKKEVLLIQDSLTDLLAEVEAAVEYPEEDIELEISKNAGPAIESLSKKVKNLAASYEGGRIIKEGLNVAIVGKPNVGKSSLLNRLLGSDKAIVSSIPGTTRDALEHTFELDGIAINIKDTAGIRSTNDVIEDEGVKRSIKALNESNMVLFLMDLTTEIEEEDNFVSEQLKGIKDDVVVVWNKLDACESRSELGENAPYGLPKQLAISAKSGEGLAELKNIICAAAKSRIDEEGVIITNIRHRHLLEKAAGYLDDAATQLQALMDMDCVTIDLNAAWSALGEITGVTVGEEIIDRIFEKFCLGK